MQRLRFLSSKPGQADGVGAISGEKYIYTRACVLLLGDSITQQGAEPNGWAAALTAAYGRDRKADVINRGFSGYNSRHLLRALPILLPQVGAGDRVAAVTLLIGSNDATRPGSPQHVPVSEYTANVQSILRAVREAFPNAALFVITPPPVDKIKLDAEFKKQGKGDGSGRSLETVEAYVKEARAVARKEGAALVDLHASMLAQEDWKARFLSDGLHLTGGGNKHLFELLCEVMAKDAPDMLPGNLSMHLPKHTDANDVFKS